jgi:uncharacterized protein DUF4192
MSEDKLTGSALIHGPADLLQAVPYLLGFHPVDSLVLIGLDGAHLVVTARMDLSDVAEPAAVAHTLGVMARGGATRVLFVVYDSGSAERPPPWGGLAAALQDDCDRAGCGLSDVLRVADGHWWSLLCTDPRCCPAAGNPLPDRTSPFVAAATYAGVVALPDRQALADTLQPQPEPQLARLGSLLRAHQLTALRATADGTDHTDGTGGNRRRYERERVRALFAAARRASPNSGDADGDTELSDSELIAHAVALTTLRVRDRIWLAIDDGRLDGRRLWRAMSRRLPAPYDAPPLFLFGWANWRHGNGALALIAAERAIESDPQYTAADLLLATLSHGLDPRNTPPLRPRRAAAGGTAGGKRTRSRHAA